MRRLDSVAMTKEDGIKLREARRARVRRIRARVIGGSVALFLAVWMLITVVLVTGHDPALARKTLTQTSTPAVTTTSSGSSGSVSADTSSGGSSDSTGSTSSSDSTGSSSSGATSTSTGSGSSGVSSVTSSQS
jgi:cobalamin biosynthesis Mg chelatase CobN